VAFQATEKFKRRHSEARFVPKNPSLLEFKPQSDSSLRLPAAGRLGMTR
jgi:hypothetical protein